MIDERETQFLEHVWKLYLPTSCSEPRNFVCASRRIMFYSIKLHCCSHNQWNLDVTHRSTTSTIIGVPMVNDHYLDPVLDSRNAQFQITPARRTYVGRRKTDTFTLNPGLMTFGRKFGGTHPNIHHKMQDSNGIRKTKARRCTPIERNLFRGFG